MLHCELGEVLVVAVVGVVVEVVAEEEVLLAAVLELEACSCSSPETGDTLIFVILGTREGPSLPVPTGDDDWLPVGVDVPVDPADNRIEW